MVTEPQKGHNWDDLDPVFRAKLERTLAAMKVLGKPMKFDEGFRTVDRQRWLHGQGRPAEKPFGRAGDVVTNNDGVTKLSNHQGTGKPGTGRGADCYPAKIDGTIIWPPPPDKDPIWNLFATIAESQGLVAGHRWRDPHDSPHVELK